MGLKFLNVSLDTAKNSELEDRSKKKKKKKPQNKEKKMTNMKKTSEDILQESNK